MTQVTDLAARILAQAQGRAVVVRATRSLSADPRETFGIAPIRMVSEEHIQAIAFGDLSATPTVATRWNPLSRDTGELELFADALIAYTDSMLAAELLPRIWLPHEAALSAVEILGHRYHRNASASPAQQRMGQICRAVAQEAQYAGQQLVAVATAILREHVVTGQMPIKDGHLGALLAWVEPVDGHDPALVADERSLLPAAAMLNRASDDAVEVLRRTGKRRGRAAEVARDAIRAHLVNGAVTEWELLVAGRRAFDGLALPVAPEVDLLRKKSYDRAAWRLQNDMSWPVQPDTLARRLRGYEEALGLDEDVAVRSDARVRERFRRKGRVIRADVRSVSQPTPNRKPCDVTLATDQEVLRIRRGVKLQTLNAKVAGRVTQVHEDPATGETLIEVRLSKGVLRNSLPAVGSTLDWTDTVYEDRSFRHQKTEREMATRSDPLIYGRDIDPAPEGAGTTGLLDTAEGLRSR